MAHHSQPSLALSRRAMLRIGLAGGALASAPLSAPLSAQWGRKGFTHNVASGEPGPQSVLLWTRYVAAQETALRWEIADDETFLHTVAGGTVTASPDHDWCIKAQARGLEPGQWYYFRFIAPDGAISPTGQTRTLPAGNTPQFRMAVFSCANIGFGWFNAYAHAAEAGARREFDLAVHTGDYFYEYKLGTYPDLEAKLPERVLIPEHEAVALADYRLRYAAYRDDPDLQRLHQVLPMIAGWDDHESANDSWKGGAENHQSATEGPWDLRKQAAMRAYREWMPVSDEPWVSYEIGDLATLFRLETRLLGRDAQPDLGAVLKGVAGQDEAMAALTAFRDGKWRDPARSMLGTRQEKWLADGLKRSTRAGKRWQVLAQQVIMGEVRISPRLIEGFTHETPQWLRQRLTASATASAAGLPFNMDAWDGYPAARSRLLQSSLNADANLVVLAGDSHNAWAFNLDFDGEAAGVEFAGHSVTSPGAETALPWIRPDDLAKISIGANRQLEWADTSQRGYMAVELTPHSASSEYRFMETVRQKNTQLAGTHHVFAAHGARRMARRKHADPSSPLAGLI